MAVNIGQVIIGFNSQAVMMWRFNFAAASLLNIACLLLTLWLSISSSLYLALLVSVIRMT